LIVVIDGSRITHANALPPSGRRQARWLGPLAALLLVTANGCTWDRWYLFTDPPPLLPAESLVLRGDHLEPDVPSHQEAAVGLLATGHEMYRKGDFEHAELVFHKVQTNKKTTPALAEEAIFYEAESLRQQRCYPKAADTYNKLLNEFKSGAYREQCIERMFEIANFWLADTRAQMVAEQEKAAGKRWVVWPEFLHFDREKPLLDEPGRAVEKLEQVRYNDMTGPYADKALFLAGGVKFFNADYKEADFYYHQIVEMHPNSPFAPQAIKLDIICKQLANGGAAYDGRNVAEARRLVDTALRSYPELASKEADFLNRQLLSITNQQAQKDFEAAEFYGRTGHPCSAYFCYAVVRQRYPGTHYADLAGKRMAELNVKIEEEERKKKKDAPHVSSADMNRPGPEAPSMTPGMPNLSAPANAVPGRSF
jgi:outer membrane protein assembly factor BamD (BamD/ComL family)